MLQEWITMGKCRWPRTVRVVLSCSCDVCVSMIRTRTPCISHLKRHYRTKQRCLWWTSTNYRPFSLVVAASRWAAWRSWAWERGEMARIGLNNLFITHRYDLLGSKCLNSGNYRGSQVCFCLCSSLSQSGLSVPGLAVSITTLNRSMKTITIQ